MTYNIRKTQQYDLKYLQTVERLAGNAFRTLPELAWLADDSVTSIDEHKHIFAHGFSWVAFETTSQVIAGFILAEIIEGDFYIKEVSVSEAYQKKGIGSKLFAIALESAKSLGVTTATLTTFKDVPWNAPYYERLGFVILTKDNLPNYLQITLQEETRAGLPSDLRCAMRKTL